ncbi:hypothetical protein SLE2022_188300 [Rubroshorea leprosula]
MLYNKVCAFAGWPGTQAKILLVDNKNGNHNILELKIVTTGVCSDSNIQRNEADDIALIKGNLIFPCG